MTPELKPPALQRACANLVFSLLFASASFRALSLAFDVIDIL
jgi:hypothetical protein